jgi:hypothetical protein
MSLHDAFPSFNVCSDKLVDFLDVFEIDGRLSNSRDSLSVIRSEMEDFSALQKV